MYIELTDHLRCPAGHPEQFLVLLPSRMEGRRVLTGELGCPVCGRVVFLEEGVADWRETEPSEGRTALTAEAVVAFLGLSGPGGFALLAGGVTALAPALARLLPGVRLVLVNPPAGTPDTEDASVLRAARVPLKSGSMRGAVIGADVSGDPDRVAECVAAVLPGLRVVGEGREPPATGVEVRARSTDSWVGKRIGSQGAGEPGS
ncbi:MAG TPA: hypothetical protein VLB00_00535 [Gemmatimonadales bacterium]|nr:hypothetical protein [Gemmatimonadales bacterium]